jgi:integrase/recombinase XerC
MRRTYSKALVDFFMQVANAAPTNAGVGEFLALDLRLAPYDRLKYKGRTSENSSENCPINDR